MNEKKGDYSYSICCAYKASSIHKMNTRIEMSNLTRTAIIAYWIVNLDTSYSTSSMIIIIVFLFLSIYTIVCDVAIHFKCDSTIQKQNKNK